jgi:hypothetical protein
VQASPMKEPVPGPISSCFPRVAYRRSVLHGQSFVAFRGRLRIRAEMGLVVTVKSKYLLPTSVPTPGLASKSKEVGRCAATS